MGLKRGLALGISGLCSIAGCGLTQTSGIEHEIKNSYLRNRVSVMIDAGASSDNLYKRDEAFDWCFNIGDMERALKIADSLTGDKRVTALQRIDKYLLENPEYLASNSKFKTLLEEDKTYVSR